MRHCQLILISLIVILIGCSSEREPTKGPEIQAQSDGNKSAVRAVISEILKLEAAAIPMDRPISDPPLKADELDLVEIIMELEDRLGVKISDATVELYAGKLGKGPIKVTPNQLVLLVEQSPKSQQSKKK
jgi:acyl carrier protein